MKQVNEDCPTPERCDIRRVTRKHEKVIRQQIKSDGVERDVDTWTEVVVKCVVCGWTAPDDLLVEG